jgi:ribonuclease R
MPLLWGWKKGVGWIMDILEKKVLTSLAKIFFPPITVQELAEAMSLEQRKIESALSSLEEKKIVIKVEEHYCPNPQGEIIAGLFQSHVRGYGFVHVGRDCQYYVGPAAAKGARDGDILLCQVLARDPGKAPAVKVLDFLASTEKIVAAVYQGQSHLGSIQEGNRKIMIPGRHSKGAKDGDCVLAAIPGWEGRVVALLPEEDKPFLDLLNIAAKKGIYPVFSDAVQGEAAALEQRQEEVARRMDLRQEEMVTVDGEDSKDLDDGFSLSRQPDGSWRLGIHIADVAHFVTPGSQLDREAFGRGSSVYLIDRELPMLPVRLSRDLCSLLPDQDRLAVSCLAEISPEGEVTNYQFAETVVRSRQRLTYMQAEAGGSQLLTNAAELGQILNARRRKRGAAYIQLPSAAITLDTNGIPTKMGPKESGGSRGLVEEFMVLANELAADFLWKNNVSLLYRGNEGFYPGREEELKAYLAIWDQDLYYPPSSLEMQQLLDAIKGSPEELLISRKLARSLHKSRYSWAPLGHYNLAVPRYTHFSSPIRRYSDLFVHRQIKGVLNGLSLLPLERSLPRVAEQCSYRERLAQDIEGTCFDEKRLEFMASQQGVEFPGVVAELTGNGPLVWLENTVEGIIVAGDREEFDKCRPGDRVTVRVHKLDKNSKAIFFALVGIAIDR